MHAYCLYAIVKIDSEYPKISCLNQLNRVSGDCRVPSGVENEKSR